MRATGRHHFERRRSLRARHYLPGRIGPGDGPIREPAPLPYLDDAGAEPWGLDVTLSVRLNGHEVSRPPFASTYWTGAQQLAHLTVNAASVRTGDLYAFGTVSGPERQEWGSLMELSWGGRELLRLPDGSTRTFLEDGDDVVISAVAAGSGGRPVGIGEVAGRVLPSRSWPAVSA